MFQVTIGNASNAGFTGPVLVGDALLIGGAAQQGAPVTVSPPFGCAPEPTSLPFNCVTNASLGGHEQQTHTVTVRMPASSIAGATNGLNCFFATDGGNGAGNLARTSLAGIAPHAGNGPGYSCVSFTVQPVAQPCPGDLVRIGTQCKCPEGLTQGRDYTCRGGTRIVPIPLPLPIPVNPVCQDRERRMTSGECCPQGTVAYGNACRAKETPQRCLPPMVGTFGNCHCPDGLVYNGDRNTCVPPRVPCPDGTVGRYQPDCQVVRVPCPEGTIGRYQPDCKVVRLPCPAGTVGKYQPNCQVVRVPCPAGTSGDYQPNCKVLVPCPRGTVGTYQPNCQLVRVPCPAGTSGDYQPNCKVRVPCPRGTVGTYQPNCQVVRIPCPAGTVGDYQPNCKVMTCPQGTHGRYPVCLPDQVRCPAGTVGDYQPNCKVMTCPQGTHGRYPVCLPDQARCPAGTIGRYQPDCKVVKQPPLESTCGPGTVKIGNFCRPLNIGPKLNLPPGIFNQPGGPVLR